MASEGTITGKVLYTAIHTATDGVNADIQTLHALAHQRVRQWQVALQMGRAPSGKVYCFIT